MKIEIEISKEVQLVLEQTGFRAIGFKVPKIGDVYLRGIGYPKVCNQDLSKTFQNRLILEAIEEEDLK